MISVSPPSTQVNLTPPKLLKVYAFTFGSSLALVVSDFRVHYFCVLLLVNCCNRSHVILVHRRPNDDTQEQLSR